MVKSVASVEMKRLLTVLTSAARNVTLAPERIIPKSTDERIEGSSRARLTPVEKSMYSMIASTRRDRNA